MNPEIVAPPAEEMGDPKSPAALEEIHVQERRPIFGLCNILLPHHSSSSSISPPPLSLPSSFLSRPDFLYLLPKLSASHA